MLVELLTRGGGNSIWMENALLALFTLLCLLGVRGCVFYKFQMQALEIVAPDIRKAVCGRLFGYRDDRSIRTVCLSGFRSDLRMIFDLTKWRFHDFYPGLGREEHQGL